MNQSLRAVANEVEQDSSTLERELVEIDLLLRQTTTEVERHAARRIQAEQRVSAMENDSGSPPEAISEARTQLLAQTRRATLMEAHIEVLSGKQRPCSATSSAFRQRSRC
ncbi:hypothetical protein BH24CHL5_BH24CHL5_00860 [soil metagenome]